MEQVIRAFYDSWLTRDLASVGTLFTEDTVLEQPPYALDGGDREGREGIELAFATLFDQFDYDDVEVHEMVPAPVGALVRVTARGCGRTSGVPIEQRLLHVYEFEEGRIRRLAWFFEDDRAQAERRAGLV